MQILFLAICTIKTSTINATIFIHLTGITFTSFTRCIQSITSSKETWFYLACPEYCIVFVIIQETKNSFYFFIINNFSTALLRLFLSSVVVNSLLQIQSKSSGALYSLQITILFLLIFLTQFQYSS